MERDQVDVSREPPDAFGTLVAAPVERSSFLCADASVESPFVVHRVPGGFASWRGTPLVRAFVERYRVTSVLALRLATEDIEGYLFALDRRTLSIDDLLVGDIVGRLVAGALEQQALMMQLRDTAVGEERLRLARDVPRLPRGLIGEICRMTEESVVNAIRHGGATDLSVELTPIGDGGLRLAVSYRGRGFATFTGRHDLTSLNRREAGRAA